MFSYGTEKQCVAKCKAKTNRATVRPRAAAVFDVMGRRVASAKPGGYLVREELRASGHNYKPSGTSSCIDSCFGVRQQAAVFRDTWHG